MIGRQTEWQISHWGSPHMSVALIQELHKLWFCNILGHWKARVLVKIEKPRS